MSSCLQLFNTRIMSSRWTDVPDYNASFFGATTSIERLPTEYIGFMTLTLNNVVVGSRVNIRDQAGTTTIYDDVAATSSVVISIPVYAVGSSLNDLRIKVRKASGSPNYIPYETLTTAVVGAQSIYVSQIPDE